MELKFAERLMELRQEKGLTKTQLGQIFHVARTTIYHWEHGVQEPNYATLLKLAEFFNVSVGYLLGVED